jgi:hypothetical protein
MKPKLVADVRTDVAEIIGAMSIAEDDNIRLRHRLEGARYKLAATMKCINEIEELIKAPNAYSGKQWERLRTTMEVMAQKLNVTVELMDYLRPLGVVED